MTNKNDKVMKAEDLMIGDWVYLPSIISDDKYPVQVLEIQDDCIKYYGGGKKMMVMFKYIEPIPLTPEILEKNGFVLKEKEKGMYGVNIAPHYTRDDVPFEVFCDGEPFAIWFKGPVNIEYVHQLQHALRLCGIEKEIVL